MRGRTMRALAWAFAATAGTRIVTLLGLTILARLLAPREFGLLAFALIYLTYAETIGDLGTATALIYWRERRDDAAQVTFVINLAMGLAWCAITIALAPFVADFFDNPEAAPIIRVLAFGFIVKFLGNTHDALAQKDLRFRARAIPEVGQAVMKAGLSIALAIGGLGAWSLVWGHLGGLAVWTIGAWAIVPWRPRLALPEDLFAPMLRYGRGIVGVNVLAAIVHHADLAIVGRMLGATALGLYQIAYKIPEATITVVMWVVSKVLFPSFAKLRDEKELRGAYLKALAYVSLVTVPMATVLCVAAEPIVRVFFGAKWMDAVPLLRWLAVYAGIRSIGTNAGDVLKATGRTGLLAGLGVLKAALLLPALIMAARTSAVAVAMTLAGVTAITAAINIVVVMRILRVRSVARRFAEENLLSIHSRTARLRAIVFGARVRGTFREPLLLRREGREILFVFDDEGLQSVVKRGESLQREADVLRALDFPGLPRVQHFDGEQLVLSPVPGRSLYISMQRSLQPRRGHAVHLANAGRWLGRFHAATRSGDDVAVHGDFWSRNILYIGDEVSGVVDWEHGSLRGSPWKDLFTLPLLFVRDAPAWIARDRRRDLERGPISEIVNGYFRAYVAEAGGDLHTLRAEFERRWASAFSG